MKADPCPCGRPLPYVECCGRLHAGSPAPDAESLMRSRYVAYVLENEDYLLATWHASTRPGALDLAAEPRPKWLGLKVVAATQAGVSATIEFIARYRIGGRGQRLHEISRFVREEGCWYYTDGIVDAAHAVTGQATPPVENPAEPCRR